MTIANTIVRLKDYGLKVTPRRAAILEAFLGRHAPMTAEELKEKLQKSAPQKSAVDLVTIYRTLSVFEKVGIVRRVDLRKDAVAYEMAGDHHHHIVCRACGAVEDFELCEMEKLTKKIAAQSKRFSTIQEHTLELFGLCKMCE